MLGADISWPQCPPGMGIEHKETSGQPMPTEEAEYVVIGLTNGPGFHANPCLPTRSPGPRSRGLLVAAYAVISWPDEAAQEQYGGLREAGYAQAQFNLGSMEAAGLDSPIVWLDVEQVPHYEWCGQHRGQRRGGARRRPGLPRRRLPDRRLLDAVHLGGPSWAT